MTRAPSNLRTDRDVAGLRVLIVEDDYFIADELANALRRKDAQVLGPTADLEQARNLLEGLVDVAVLDINIAGELIFDFAREVRQRGVSMLFTTGYDASAIPDTFRDVPRFEKPVDIGALMAAVCGSAPATTADRQDRL